ncbi:uncharacterized protein LOC122850697 [Aphidius gifuensis]|uniref:uncharacterized protein LOC122850697 n=1 Tax=Aphidius gifuensis TaxID=684658 RepID=UPI001CDBAA8D|nr:uncharacterized protein LOC122850697 [Aphidius gifuensis]
MFCYKEKYCHLFISIYIISVVIVIETMSLSLSSDDVTESTTFNPTTTDEYYKREISTVITERDVNEVTDEKNTTTPSVVLQPNIAGALDVGQGLLVPLVPVVDTNANLSQTNQTSPLMANLLPVTVKTVDTHPEIRRSVMDSYQDLDVAEDIIFRPLFRYRQEEQQKLSQRKNYQPYIYHVFGIIFF